MNNTKIETSLDDTTELRKLILDNPDLPLIIFAGEEAYQDEYCYCLTEAHGIDVKEICCMEDNEGVIYIDKEDYEDKLYDNLSKSYETQEEVEKVIKEKMQQTEFLKAIVVYVG